MEERVKRVASRWNKLKFVFYFFPTFLSILSHNGDDDDDDEATTTDQTEEKSDATYFEQKIRLPFDWRSNLWRARNRITPEINTNNFCETMTVNQLPVWTWTTEFVWFSLRCGSFILLSFLSCANQTIASLAVYIIPISRFDKNSLCAIHCVHSLVSISNGTI